MRSNSKLGKPDQKQVKKYSLRLRTANKIVVKANQMMSILNVLRWMTRTQMMFKKMKIM